MELICDDREHKICLLIRNKYDHVYVEHLTVGDFLIGYKLEGKFVPLVVIERKTWADLAASFKDGRIGNVEKLLSYRERTGARIAYLLEGFVPANASGALIEGIPYKNLRAHLDHLLYKEGIIELHTNNPSDSLRRLLEFANNLSKFMTSEQPCAAAPDGISEAKVKAVVSDEQISDRIWATFEGVSLSSARAFRHLNIASLYKGEIDADQLANLLIGARKLGPARATSILSSLPKEHTLEKILCAVPRISTKRARIILDCLVDKTIPLPLQDLFINWSTYKQILIEKKLGDICLANIEKHLFNSPVPTPNE